MEVKGAALASIPRFVLDTFGKKGFNDWINALPDLQRDLYRNPVRQEGWFPLLPMMSGPTRVICDLFYGGDIRGAWEAGRFSADFALHGIYRLFVKLGSVESLINRAGVILPTYYRPSSIRVESAAGKRVKLAIEQFPEMDQIVQSRIAGWMERAVEISGQKDVRIEIAKSFLSGDGCTEFDIIWN